MISRYIACLFMLLSHSCVGISEEQRHEFWNCYSPKKHISYVAAESEVGGREEIPVVASSYLCFGKEIVDAGVVKVNNDIAGVPFRYIKNSGEFNFYVDMNEYFFVESISDPIFDDLESLVFDVEGGGEWSIKRSPKGFVQNGIDYKGESFERRVSLGYNSYTDYIYFFNLNKKIFSFVALRLDREGQCLWTDGWPPLIEVNWQGFTICKYRPS